MRYPVHYKTAIDKLLKLKENEWLQLVDFELPAEEAIQFAVSLWAEGLLEPKEAWKSDDYTLEGLLKYPWAA